MNVKLSQSTRVAFASRLLSHRSFFAVLFVSVLAIVVYHESWSQVGAAWSDGNSRVSHGWLVLAAALVILFLNLPRELSWSERRARWLWLALGLGTSVLWFATWLLSIESVAQLLALAVLGCGLHVIFSREIARETDRALLVLVFAMPVLDAFNGYFQAATIAVAGKALYLMRVPAELHGFLVKLPAGSFEIEPLCSGLQFFIAAATTGALLTAMRRDSWPRAVLIIAGAGVIGLIANWVRVITVIVAGYLTDMQSYLVHSEHYSLGWSLFVVGIGAYLYFINRLKWPKPPAISLPAGTAAKAISIVGALPLLIAPAMAMLIAPGETSAAPAQSATFSARQWRGPMASWASWAADAHGAQRHIVSDYLTFGGARVTVFVARYASPERETATFLSVTGFLPAADWDLQETDRYQVLSFEGGGTFARRSIARDRTGAPWVFVHWFQVGDRIYDSAWRARLNFSRLRLAGDPPPFVLLVFASPCAGDCVAETSAAGTLAGAASAAFIAQILE
jgi:EpsI family protein